MAEILVKNNDNKVEVSNDNMLKTILGDKYKDIQPVLDGLANKLNIPKEGKKGFFDRFGDKGVDDKLIQSYNASLELLINEYVKDVRGNIGDNLIGPIEEIIKSGPKIQHEVKLELETKVKPEPKPESEQEPKQKSQPKNQAQETLIAGLKKVGFMSEGGEGLLSAIDGTKSGI